MVEITEEELAKRIEESARRAAFVEHCRMFFTESLANAEYKFQKGEMMEETRNAGYALFQQFMAPAKPPAPAKEESKEPTE